MSRVIGPHTRDAYLRDGKVLDTLIRESFRLYVRLRNAYAGSSSSVRRAFPGWHFLAFAYAREGLVARYGDRISYSDNPLDLTAVLPGMKDLTTILQPIGYEPSHVQRHGVRIQTGVQLLFGESVPFDK